MQMLYRLSYGGSDEGLRPGGAPSRAPAITANGRTVSPPRGGVKDGFSRDRAGDGARSPQPAARQAGRAFAARRSEAREVTRRIHAMHTASHTVSVTALSSVVQKTMRDASSGWWSYSIARI